LKREVAIKILPAEFSSDADRIGRFQREAELQQRVPRQVSGIIKSFSVQLALGLSEC